MDLYQFGADGGNGAAGTVPGGDGGHGSAGASVKAHHASADASNVVYGSGGKGGAGGKGGNNPAGIGGTAGAGGNGGTVSASVISNVILGDASALASLGGGFGGSAGTPGNPGTPDQGIGANGGNGGQASRARADATTTSGAASATVWNIGGVGGTGTGAGNRGGWGGESALNTARASGTDAFASVQQMSGYGGSGTHGADGGDGARSVLVNAVSGQAAGGTLELNQFAWAGSGGAGSTGGKAGGAKSSLVLDDVAITGGAATTLKGYSGAYAGNGGGGTLLGRTGGSAYATLSLTGAGKVTADGWARGGRGGTGPDSANPSTGTKGGAAFVDVAAISRSMTAAAEAHAIAEAGDGASADGVGKTAGAGNSTSTARAFASGYAARSIAELTGGRGGEATNGANGGDGGNARLVNAVSGSASGGMLTLRQVATGGDGGNSQGGVGGSAGSARSYLTYHEDAVSSFDASAILAFSDAWTGYGGSTGGIGSSVKAAHALAHLDLSGALNVTGFARAIAQHSATTRGHVTIADATVAATSIAAGGVAAASAYADWWGPAPLLPTAVARATASTMAGQLASANAFGLGRGSAEATAITRTDGVVTSVRAVATAQVLGVGDATSIANAGYAPAGPSSSYGAYALGTASPHGSVIASALANATHVNTVLGGPTATILATGMQGGNSQDIIGTRVYSSTITWSLDTRALSGDLILGFVDGMSHGAGMRDVSISVAIEGATVLTRGFASNSRALGFLDDSVVNLGPVTQDADLQVSISFQVVLNAAQSSFGARYVLGTTDADRATMPVATRPTLLIISSVTAQAVSGVAEANADVTLRIDTAVIGSTTADDRGIWSVALPAGGPTGPFVATTTAPSGEIVVDLGTSTQRSGLALHTVYASAGYTLPEWSDIPFLSAGSNAGLSLTGNSFANTITGGAGNDTLRGGAGADALRGSLGIDTFVYAALEDSTVDPTGQDTIWDFEYLGTRDLIDLSLIDANTALAGDQAFLGGTFVSAFTGVAGELRWEQVDGKTARLSGDVNADGAADFTITLYNSFGVSLSAGQVVL